MKNIYNHKAKKLSKSRINNGVKAAIKVKNKLYASWDEVRYKHYRNKICTLICLSKMRYYDAFFENNMDNMKNPGKNQWTFTSRKKNLKAISALKIWIIATKLLGKVRAYLTLLMNTLRRYSETDLLISYPFPKNII